MKHNTRNPLFPSANKQKPLIKSSVIYFWDNQLFITFFVMIELVVRLTLFRSKNISSVLEYSRIAIPSWCQGNDYSIRFRNNSPRDNFVGCCTLTSVKKFLEEEPVGIEQYFDDDDFPVLFLRVCCDITATKSCSLSGIRRNSKL